MNINWDKIPTPYYIVDEKKLIKNLEILKSVQDKTGCKILLAQKAFSMFYFYPLIKKYLKGTTASGLFEAKLAYEEMGNDREIHIFSPAYTDAEFDEMMPICDCIVFNSFEQWQKFKFKIQNHNSKKIRCGIRVNPEYSEIETEIYNPCAKNSRLGTTVDKFDEYGGTESDFLDGISGLHFHTMCEQNSDALWRTLKVFDEKFGRYLNNMEWVNFGGGHLITRADYDIETLIKSIVFIKEKYNVEVYLEPGEAVALNTGFLVSSVLEIIENEINSAILDTSAACHMPDVLEMPYRPQVIGAGEWGDKQYNYRFGGPTCLAGDIIGDYSFDKPLKQGDKIVFCDMAHYTMVKNNTFNGINLPSIAINTIDDETIIVKKFGYEDFKTRLS